jgi:hypothetical protein
MWGMRILQDFEIYTPALARTPAATLDDEGWL